MAYKTIPTAARVRERLCYNLETGHFVWLAGRFKGKIAGTLRKKDQRIQISLDGRICFAHMLAWLWVTGEWPDRQVDHINTDTTDNRWVNLRLATPAQNSFNYAMNPRNTSGMRGVFYNSKRSQPWRAVIGHRVLGFYATAEEAHEAYKKAAIETYGEFVHPSLLKTPNSQDQ